MSDHEFENYLALLGRLLRLDAAQREAIAGELRDHLEERLAELLARGVPRRDAVRMALEEFGDAAGLAAEFVTISRNTKRRWMMRVTTLSTAAVVAMILMAVAFWPESNTGPAPPRAVAQAPQDAGTSGQPTQTKREPTTEENNAATEATLGKRIAADFVDVPLDDVLQFVGDMLDIQFYVDTAALDDAGVDREAPVTIHLSRVRGDMLLGLALRQADSSLTYVIRDGIVFVTTHDVAESETEVRVYNCRDLLGLSREGTAVRRHQHLGRGGFGGGEGDAGDAGFGGAPGIPPGAPGGLAGGGEGRGGIPGHGVGVVSGGGVPVPGSSADELINILESTVCPESWASVGGSSTIGAYNGLLVVSQTLHGHKEIDKLLKMLREAANEKPGTVVPKAVPAGDHDHTHGTNAGTSSAPTDDVVPAKKPAAGR